MSAERRGLSGQPVEVGRVADVGRVGLPLVDLAGRCRQRLPALVALEHVGVLRREQLGVDRREHRGLDLLLGRPDVLQVHRRTRRAHAQRLGCQVDIHRPCDGVGDHERRRREVVGPHERLDAALEVAVARQHRRHHQALVFDGRRHVIGQGTAVADAGRASVADEVESERVEVRRQARPIEVAGHDLRARREARLHPGLPRQALLHGLLREQARADHHAGVRRVRAARDRRDRPRRRPSISARDATAVPPPLPAFFRAALLSSGERCGKLRLGVGQRHAILRTTRPGHAGHDRREVEFHGLRVARLGLPRQP